MYRYSDLLAAQAGDLNAPHNFVRFHLGKWIPYARRPATDREDSGRLTWLFLQIGGSFLWVSLQEEAYYLGSSLGP